MYGSYKLWTAKLPWSRCYIILHLDFQGKFYHTFCSSIFPSHCLLIFYPFCRAQIPDFNVLLLVALVPKFQNLVIGYWMCQYSIWLPLNCVSFFCKSLLSTESKRTPTSEEEVGRHSRRHPVFHPPIESGQWNAMDAWYDGMPKLYMFRKKKRKIMAKSTSNWPQ